MSPESGLGLRTREKEEQVKESGLVCGSWPVRGDPYCVRVAVGP